jgi:molybdopterin molybdotransferase
VADTRAALTQAIKRATDADLLVTVGGASVGDHDLVRPVLEEAGATLGFWRVAMQPGKPLMAGRLGQGLVVGLPGNPVSAFVCARLFLVPLLRRMGGDPDPHDRPGEAVLGVPVAANGGRRQFLRARLVDGRVHPAPSQDSSLLTVLADADLLLIRPPHAAALPAGASVPVLML